ncbi:MAG: histidinol-phosphate transaminase [Planctomycetota bacterium]
MRPQPVPSLAGLSAYQPPRHPAPIDLVLAGNEGDRPNAARLLAALRDREVETLRCYPSARSLEGVLAQRLGVEAEQVMVAAGGDEAIDRLCRTYLSPDRRMLLAVPTFVMFAHYARLAGASIDEVPWPDGEFPTDAMLAQLRPETTIVTVVSPNNPTGAVAHVDALQRLSAAAPQAVLVVDVAYAEYADEDLCAAALALPNAVVVRTVSKAWGLAGLRVGYAAGPRALIEPMRAAGGPFSVSAVSLALAEVALTEGDETSARHIARVRQERVDLRRILEELGTQALPSQGNFVLVRTKATEWLRDGLAGLGIGVRIFPGVEHLADAARITCPGDAADFDRLCHALRAVLAPEAVLLANAELIRSPRRLGARQVISVAAAATTDPDHWRTTLQTGKIDHAWVLCDRPPVAQAARAAGIVPIGLMPQATPEEAHTLLAAGAARVVNDIADVEEMLS